MDDRLDFYLDTTLFRPGEKVYVNKVEIENETGFHAHDFIEIAYVTGGNGKHIIGNREYPAAKGSIFIINYDIPHKFVLAPGSEQKMTVYNCIFTPDFLDLSLLNCKDFSIVANQFLYRSFFPEDHDPPVEDYFIDQDNIAMEILFEKLYREYTEFELGYIQIIRAYVLELLVTFFRLFYKTGPVIENDKLAKRELIAKVMGFIQNNYWKDLKLEELSMMAFFSPSHFCREFKRYSGMTVSQYTQKIRVEEACSLLKSSGRKIIDIAADVGYKDIKHFNRVFKSVTGMKPSEYRVRN